MELFLLDNSTNDLVLNDFTILLVKEFEKLWDVNRNKTKEDKTGRKRTKAFREFKYIYLALDWLSPYHNDDELTRHEAALEDSGLTEKEFNNPDFREACRRYIEILDLDKSVLLVLATRRKADDLIDYLDNIADLSLLENGRPVYSAKDILAVMTLVGKLIDSLEELEKRIKDKLKASSALRGGRSDDYIPTIED